jgi:hypothetical protein
VLFALTLAGMQEVRGYREAIILIAKTIEEYTWPASSVYYPQKFVFPYAISRAWRDADARDPLLDVAMNQLIVQILDEMDDAMLLLKKPSGTIDADNLHNFQQSTALGLITLLNLGRDMAENCGMSDKYDRVVKIAVNYLVTNHNDDPARQKEITKLFPGGRVNFWESGVLYSSSVQELAHWRSHAQATSTVLEALTKYVLAYDLGRDEFLSRRLGLGCHDRKWSLSVLHGA